MQTQILYGFPNVNLRDIHRELDILARKVLEAEELRAKDATMRAMDATMSAKDAIMRAKDATMSAKDATMCGKEAVMCAKGRADS